MDGVKPTGTQFSTDETKATWALPLRSALLFIGVGSAAALWVITVAPTAVILALTASLAAGWCAWLEKHP